jgi:hypothetical protein
MCCREGSIASVTMDSSPTANAPPAKARALLAVPVPIVEPPPAAAGVDAPSVDARPCPCYGGQMIVIEVFGSWCEPKHRPMPIAIRIDTS